jgi:ankyrin repeat protein
VSLLLDKEGIDVNQAKNYGWTPLSVASEKGHSECMSLLLGKQGIDVNQALDNGSTPLHVGSEKGHTECVSLLLAMPGINVNKAMHDGRTPLSIAIQNHHARVAQIFYHRDHQAMNEFRICIFSARRTPAHALYHMSCNGHDTLLHIESFLLPAGVVVRKSGVPCVEAMSGKTATSVSSGRRKRVRLAPL